MDYVIWDYSPIGHYHHGHRTLTLHYLVNDILMALFFAIAAKEVWEAIILENGSLRGGTATPLFATAGGMFGPIAVYLGMAMMLGSDTYNAVSNGWAIPTATDIAFCYLVGRLVFGAGHPAVSFLLLLAIADDAAGLIILAIFYSLRRTGSRMAFVVCWSCSFGLSGIQLASWKLDTNDPTKAKATWVRKICLFGHMLLLVA